jgi:ADP-ribose pyrophosphatase
MRIQNTTNGMPTQRILPAVPVVKLQVIEDLTPEQPVGFIRLVRRRLVAIAPDGAHSAPFVYDEVDRKSIDAVVVAAYFFDVSGVAHVYLRSATRPPVSLRGASRSPFKELRDSLGLWELVAGLVEPDEISPSGVIECARRELAEEIGFEVDCDRVQALGPSTLPCPGVIGERHYFFRVEVEPQRRRAPSLDGSVLEQLGAIIEVPLTDALIACRTGEIEDAKTELGLRRLFEHLELRA